MINWKLRFQNKATLLAIASTVILLIQQLGFKLPDNIADVVNTFLTLLVFFFKNRQAFFCRGHTTLKKCKERYY